MLQNFTFRDNRHRKRTIEILFENEHLLAVNKPSGLPVIPDRWDSTLPNLRDLVQRKYQSILSTPKQLIWVVHRIDADTSGVVLFARSPEMHKALNVQFEKQQIKKIYLAITRGYPPQENGVINQPIRKHPKRQYLMQVHPNGKPSETHYTVLEKLKRYCLLELSPKTGRTHQIRVHLAALNTPLAIDPLYGSAEPIRLSDFKRRFRENKNIPSENRSLIERLTLHAKSLEFRDPFTGTRRFLEAPIPKDFSALLKALRKW